MIEPNQINPQILANKNWPSLWEDSQEMMQAAVFSYAFADLRALSREGKLPKVDQKRLELPVDAFDILQVLQNNREAIEKSVGEETYMLSETILESNVKEQELFSSLDQSGFFSTIQLVAFEDAKYETSHGDNRQPHKE